ncbi:cellulase family glycosylhydrolase [Labilibacter marinus]|uniref:cellulase family glycosylhydrolase n=1 Tax=Labilibacter marinus TaxID=1477105 RepID=UPI00094FA73E|nr:cellulase family glycosylhydrolase [Labilibacter marinus]
MIGLQLFSLILFIALLGSCKKEEANPSNINPSRRGQVGVRSNNGIMEFFDTKNNVKFTPMGYNYTHLLEFTYNDTTLTGHATFNHEYYNAEVTNSLLAQLQEAGYNTIRIFLNPLLLATNKTELNQDYFQNIVDFITKADQHEISVIITTDMIPIAYYNTEIKSEKDIWWWNTQFIYKAEIDLEINFWQTFIDELKNNTVPLEAILAYEIRNEFFFHPDYPPFNQDSGIVEHPNGISYNMSVESERNALLDVSFLHWTSTVRNAIREKDSKALVTVGFYAPEPLGKPSNKAITQSELDFIDIHMYPEHALLGEYANYFDLVANKSKLIIMGEFGYIENKNVSINKVTDILLDWKNEAISNYHIDGWL